MRQLSTRLLLLALLFGCALQAHAQYTVSGTVIDDLTGEPIIGASVLVKGTSTGVPTNLEGKFTISLTQDPAILVVSSVGFLSEEVSVTGSTNNITVKLVEDVARLEEIVVTGLASSVKRSNLANAVSTVSAEELVGTTGQQTVDGALYGKIPGVNITASSGAPGGGIAMRLRGVSSITGNSQPLIIIDGVYMSNAEIPSGVRFASGANRGNEEHASNRLADLDPNDIENIEVLKGASAAAIYGTRANAGVIIITTKRGKEGKTTVELRQDVGVNMIQRFVGRRVFTPETVESTFDAAERAVYEAAVAAGTVTDYEQEIYGQVGPISQTRLSVSGGDAKTSFFIGGTIRNEEGIVQNTGYDKYSIRANLDHKINRYVKVSSTTNFVNSLARRSFTGNENNGGLSYGYTLAFTRDWYNLFPDENGIYPNNPVAAGNPLLVRDLAKNNEAINRVIQGLRVDINAFESENSTLRFSINGGVDFFLNETYVYVPEVHQAQLGGQNGFIGLGRNKFLNLNYQAFGIWDNYAMDGDLILSTQAGVSYLNQSRDINYLQTTQLASGQTNASQGGAQFLSQFIGDVEEFGLILQQEANYDDKIIGTVGVRADKSSLNGNPNQYYLFPKASVAVNVANFDFWSAGSINQLKLRAAYGQTGSSAAFGALFTSLNAVSVGGSTGILIDNYKGNPDLRPETSAEFEVGADLGLFQNRLGLELSYYNRQVTDLLLERALPSSSGFTREFVNAATLTNQGIELGINGQPVRSASLSWNTTLNFWLNRSLVSNMTVPAFVPEGAGFGLGLGTFYIQEGSQVTHIWKSGADGPTPVGNTEPDFQTSWYNNFTVAKNLEISFMLHAKVGYENNNLFFLLTDLGGVSPDYDENAGDRLAALDYVMDASYVRLREAAIYYNIPNLPSSITGLKIGASARNPITLTAYPSYDPEVSTNGGGGLSTGMEVAPFPSSRQFYLHANFTF